MNKDFQAQTFGTVGGDGLDLVYGQLSGQDQPVHAQRMHGAGAATDAGEAVEPAGRVAAAAQARGFPVVLRVEVRARRVGRAGRRDHGQAALLPQRQHVGQGGVQGKGVVQLERGLIGAVGRGQGNAGAQAGVVRVGVGHEQRQAIDCAAQEHDDEAAFALGAQGGLGKGAWAERQRGGTGQQVAAGEGRVHGLLRNK